MFRVVAVAMVALKVTCSVVGEVITALSGVGPARLVVYAGVPLSMTAWLNVTVRTATDFVAVTMPIGVVGCGRLARGFVFRNDVRERCLFLMPTNDIA